MSPNVLALREAIVEGYLETGAALVEDRTRSTSHTEEAPMSRYASERGPDVRHTHRLPAEEDKSRRVTRQYAMNGVAGLVERRRVRQTKTFVEIYRVDQAGLDVEEPWAVVCAAHGSIFGCASLSLAKDQASDPNGWCDQCEGEP